MRHVGGLLQSMQKQFVGVLPGALVSFAVECISCDLTTPALLFLPQLHLEGDEGREHEPGFIATLGGQPDKLVRSLLPFIAAPDDEPKLFPRCGGSHRSEAAVSPDGGRNWMAAEELGPLE